MYIIEGNIGSGKSTFLKLVSEHFPHISPVFEPRHHWQDEGGDSLLTNFYQNPKRWAYTLETLTMVCRVREHQKWHNSPAPVVMERSIYSGHYCFAQNDFDNGFMNAIEWDTYNQWFNFLVNGRCNPPRGFIYLKTTPEVAHERIQKRSRSSEAGIPLEYLKQIHDCHIKFLVDKKNVLPELQSVPVLVLESDAEFEKDSAVLSEHLAKVADFFKKTNTYSLPNQKSAMQEQSLS
jgi:deoxyadenosine/deoxycytidine kinase